MITAIGFSGGWMPGQLAIQALTLSHDAHVFGVVNDGKTIIDATYHSGVMEREFSDLKFDWIHFVQLAPIATHSQRINLEYMARCEIGKDYDFGFLLGFPFDREWRKNNKWVCSELWGHVLIESGIMPELERKMHRLTPRNLHNRLEELKR